MSHRDLAAVLVLEDALFGNEAWTEGMLAAELAGVPDSRYYLVAEDESTLVGYAGLMDAGGQADVLTMAVAQDRWGEGIGATLLTELLAEATRRGCREVFLEVRVDNPRAQSLYRRYGFAEVGVRRGYYQPSGTDALVMRWAADGEPAGRRAGDRRAGGQRTGGQRRSGRRPGGQRAGGQRAEGTG
jgi:ribosomal-protein-alanine N-acetyltransferase